MKTLKRLFLLAFVVAAVGAGWLRSSPYWTILEIQQGLEHKDVERVERVVALERFSASSTAALGSVVANELGAAGTDPGGQLLGAIAEVIGKGVGEAVARDAARGLRTAIQNGELQRRVGPLEVNAGWQAFGRMATTIDGAQVEIKGTCDGSPASVVLELERHDDGPFGGHPRRFVVVGIEPSSAKALAKQCAAAPAKPAR